MRRITLFIGSLSGGGAERVTCNLANYLNEKGYSVDVLTMSISTDGNAANVTLDAVEGIKNKFGGQEFSCPPSLFSY